MRTRLRLLMGATALLYFGPLLAGLGGFGWAVVPVFTAIFLLWLVILRPQDWPRGWAGWRQPQALIGLATRAAVQLLLVSLCFGIGRGIGGVLGAQPPFPVMLPITISFLSIPLARLVWEPRKAQQLDGFLTEALAEVEAVNRHLVPEAAVGMVRPLADLPSGTDDETLAGHLEALSRHLSPVELAGALQAHAGRSATARRALALLPEKG